MSETETQTPPPEEPAKKKSLFARMKEGLSRSTRAMSDGVTGIFTKRKLDTATLEELEDLLVTSDLGLDVHVEITEAVAKDRYDKEVSPEEVRDILAEELAAIREAIGTEAYEQGRYELAAKIFTDTATGEDLPDFLTLPAYEALRQFD